MTTSKEISEKFNIEHRLIRMAIERHYTTLKAFGEVRIKNVICGRGHPIKLYVLNDKQADLVSFVVKSTPAVNDWRVRYIMRARNDTKYTD